MALRKLTPDEQDDREQLDKLRDRFMGFLEGAGWVILIAFIVFFADQASLIDLNMFVR